MAEFRATYRLQLVPGAGFDFARALVPYLHDLGISHLYLSPSFQAREGSQHGYDVVDPTRISDALGGEAAFRALAAAARAVGMGLLLDIVPNHMATDDANPFWTDEAKRGKFFDLDRVTGRHRRFFDIDHLAGVRQEDPEVFEETHRLALSLVRDGVVDGLRIDHPDGMADPAGYLAALRAGGADHVWVEKILSAEDPVEHLRPDWATSGTVGYEFLNDVCGLFVDPRGEAALTALWEELAADDRPFEAWADAAKREQAHTTFRPEIERLARDLGEDRDIDLESAVAALPVYRTYLWDGQGTDEDAALLAGAGLEWVADAPEPFVRRFQQTTPPVMAKGVEDTAFYRYCRLLALNDVGGEPGRFGIPVAAFHAGNAERAARVPLGLLATQTHDTKRSGDVRARLGAIAALADEWVAAVRSWREAAAPLRSGGAPDAVEEYTILQTLAGAWPIDADRLWAYMEKAMRERKATTSWIEPDEDWEGRVEAYCRAIVGFEPFLAQFEPFAARLAEVGDRHALAQLALKLTVPGVPDIYQGDELLALSLVDPDNRRPVDFDRRRGVLAGLLDGAPVVAETRKLWLVWKLLGLRAARPEAFGADGAYAPLDVGEAACAFVRGGDVVVAVGVREDAWRSVSVPLPEGSWRPVLSEGADPVAGSFVLGEAAPEDGIAVLERVAG
jgi:(1->4)-alpha-D-glucan 1-alpha-D-glucosylmutase